LEKSLIDRKKLGAVCASGALLLACPIAAPAQDAAPSAARTDVAGLREIVSDPRVRSFYEARDWQAAWSGEAERQILELLDDAVRHGLHRSMFMEGAIPGDPAHREAVLSRAALDYAQALAAGRTDPQSLREIYTLGRPSVDLASGLNGALSGGDLAGWLSGLAPQDAAYRTLSEAYLRLRNEAEAEPSDPIEAGALIRAGEQDPRVPRIAQRLAELGYLDSASPNAGERFDGDLVAALERLQDDSGIAADGVVGPSTLERLNSGAADRARQLAVNLERLRWLDRDPPPSRIDVNVAATRLQYWRDGSQVDTRRVIAGQPGWETPMLGSPIFRLVANPTWTVPKSIEREELAGRGEAYLRSNNMIRRDGWIVQQPGPDNALGEVKFDMHNDHAIFLHDTPAKHLFDHNERHRSHGCVRVEDALGFARMLARDQGVLSEFEDALASGEETFVPLPRNLPVRLLYQTAFADADGSVGFRPDVYGWDADVAEALGLGPLPRPGAGEHVDDGVTP
jgi:murein L,D-transpeptidase YcbB/YkuD